MEISKEQLQGFIELNKGLPGFDKYSEAQVREMANGVANFYLSLFKIAQRIKNEEPEIEW